MVEWKKLWEVTIWDKKFIGVAKEMQPTIIRYHYYFANELAELERENGDIRILYTTDKVAYANSTDVKDFISEGEIVAIPGGGNVSIKYYKGKFVTADNRIATSNNIAVLNNKYLYYWMLSRKEYIGQMYRGAGIKHPSMLSVLSMQIPIPSIKEQEHIVDILDTLTSNIDNLKNQIEHRQKQYEFYREQLLDLEGKEGVEWKELGEFLDYIQPTEYRVKSTNYNDNYDTPVLTAGQSLILGYTDEKDGIFAANKKSPTIIFDDFTTSFHWIDFNFKVKSSAMKMLVPKIGTNFRYIYYAMQQIHFTPTQHQRHWISKYSHFLIPIPPLSKQQRIVDILDTFEESIVNLESQLAEREKQYEYYRNQLLTFE